MIFGLDYDGTYTETPELWLGFIGRARAEGHQVVVVTWRNDYDHKQWDNTQLNELLEQGHVDGIVYADLKPKRTAALKEGWEVDVWIDDMPEAVGHGLDTWVRAHQRKLRERIEDLEREVERLKPMRPIVEAVQTWVDGPGNGAHLDGIIEALRGYQGSGISRERRKWLTSS